MSKDYHVVGCLALLALTLFVLGKFTQPGFNSVLTLEKGGRLALVLEDEDFLTYFSGQSWVFRQQTLYENGYAEYPPLGLMYINWSRFVTSDFSTYANFLRLSNILFFVLAGWLTWRLGSLVNPQAPVAWWLWLLPSAFYFSLNYFDIFPVTLVLASLYFILRGHSRLGWFIYGLSIMAKFYPIFLLPLYIALTSRRPGQLKNDFIYALAAVLGLNIGAALSGGWAAVIMPLGVQLSRTAEPGSMLYLLFAVWPTLVDWRLIYHSLIQIGQLFLPMIWLWTNIIKNIKLSLKTQLILSALTLFIIINLQPFYSNQFWLWVLPFIILVLPKSLVWVLIIYDVVNYFQFPISFQVWGRLNPIFFGGVAGVRVLVAALLIIVLWRQLPKKWWALSTSGII